MSEIPDSVPSAVTISEFAAALNFRARTVRSWVDSGRLETLPTEPKQKRLIPVAELSKFEAQGWPVDWEILI